MRITLYVIGVLFITLAIFFFLATFGANGNNEIIGYGLGTCFLFGGAVIFCAAIEDYKGGLCFLFGTLILSLSILLIWSSYGYYHDGKLDYVKVGSIVTLVLMVFGFILLRLGHKRHKSIQAASASQSAASNIVFANNISDEVLTTSSDSVDILPEQSHPCFTLQ